MDIEDRGKSLDEGAREQLFVIGFTREGRTIPNQRPGGDTGSSRPLEREGVGSVGDDAAQLERDEAFVDRIDHRLQIRPPAGSEDRRPQTHTPARAGWTTTGGSAGDRVSIQPTTLACGTARSAFPASWSGTMSV